MTCATVHQTFTLKEFKLKVLMILCLFVLHLEGYEYGICEISDVTLSDDLEAAGNITSDGYPRYIPAKAWNSKNCRQNIVACPECRIVLKFTDLQLPNDCDQPVSQGSCIHQCDHIYLHEPDYPESTTRYYFGKNEGETYISQTRRVYLLYCGATAYNAFQKRFRIQYSVQERRTTYEGVSGENGTFTSPNFPVGYTRNSDVYQYYIHNKNGFIKLSFEDWNLAPTSKITVYIHNNTETNRYLTRIGTGDRPFIISTGADLLVKFEAGSHDVYDTFTYMGFKARYEFVSANSWVDKPFHDCGEYYHSLAGGFVEFDGTTRCWPDDVVECLWVVFKYSRNDQLSLRIDAVSLNDNDLFEIRQGNNSDSQVIVSSHINVGGAEYVTDDAFYIRLRTRCNDNRFFKAVFSSFSNSTYNPYTNPPWYDCPSRTQYACHNGRCIEKTMICDGLNHCGDMSDELSCTTPVSTTPVKCSTHLLCRSGEWYCIQKRCDSYIDCKDGSDELNCGEVAATPTVSGTGNNSHVFSAYHWGTIIPIILICVVLAVIACITVSYYTRRKQRSRRRRNRRSSTAAHAPAVPSVTGGVAFGGMVPPRYTGMDAPPSYEESLQFTPGEGVLNLAYRADSMDYLAQPPPYTPVCDEPLPVRYVPTPAVHQDPPPRGRRSAYHGNRGNRPSRSRHEPLAVPMYRDPPHYTPGHAPTQGPPPRPRDPYPRDTHPQDMFPRDMLDSHSRTSSATSTMESRSSIGPISMLSVSSSSDSCDSVHSLRCYQDENRNPMGAHHSFNSSLEGNISDTSQCDVSPGRDDATHVRADVQSSDDDDSTYVELSPREPRSEDSSSRNSSRNKVHNATDLPDTTANVPHSRSSQSMHGDNKLDSCDSLSPELKADTKFSPVQTRHDESCDSVKFDEDISIAAELMRSGALHGLQQSSRHPHSSILDNESSIHASESSVHACDSNSSIGAPLPTDEMYEEYIAFEHQHDATFV